MYGTIMHLDHTFHLIITYTYSPQHTNEVFCKLVKDKVDFITVWVGDEIVAEKRRSKVTYPESVAKRLDLLSEREQEDLASGQHPRLEDWVAGKIARGSLQFKPYKNERGEYV